MFVVIFLVALVGGAGYIVNESRIGLNVQGISFHGKIALMLDVAGTFFMSAGWMFLVFCSSRRGYEADENIQVLNLRAAKNR